MLHKHYAAKRKKKSEQDRNLMKGVAIQMQVFNLQN